MKYRKWVNKMTKKVANQSLLKKHIISDFCLFWLFKKDPFFIYYFKTDFHFLMEAWGILAKVKNMKEVKWSLLLGWIGPPIFHKLKRKYLSLVLRPFTWWYGGEIFLDVISVPNILQLCIWVIQIVWPRCTLK